MLSISIRLSFFVLLLPYCPLALTAAPLKVIATTGMIADTTRAIGAELLEVKPLMGPGVDPHGYRLTRSDIAAMRHADIVLYNGLYLEAQVEPLLKRLKKHVRIEALAEQAIPKAQRHAHPSYQERYDPHVWMAPMLWAQVAKRIEQILSEILPEHKTALASRLAQYLTQLERLDIDNRQKLSSIPKEHRVLLTAHDAFGYFGTAYNFEVVGIQGLSTQSEPALSRITALVEHLVAQEIPAVFVESSVSERNIRALIEGAAARGHKLKIGGMLYSDAMGPPGSGADSYLTMITHNVNQISSALGK